MIVIPTAILHYEGTIDEPWGVFQALD